TVFALELFQAWHDFALWVALLTGLPGDLWAQPREAREAIFRQFGEVSAADWLDGRWWRLLSVCFFSPGLLELGVGLTFLFGVGGFLERAWGGWRTLAVFLVSGWGGSASVLAMRAGGTIGLAGGLWGLVGALAVWAILYDRFLPGEKGRRLRNRAEVTAGALFIISLLAPGVSGPNCVGGAVSGIAAAVVLHFQ